jgi:hypothetical protein
MRIEATRILFLSTQFRLKICFSLKLAYIGWEIWLSPEFQATWEARPVGWLEVECPQQESEGLGGPDNRCLCGKGGQVCLDLLDDNTSLKKLSSSTLQQEHSSSLQSRWPDPALNIVLYCKISIKIQIVIYSN